MPAGFRIPGAALIRKAGAEPDLGLILNHLRFTSTESDQQRLGIQLATGVAIGEALPKPEIFHLSGDFLIWDYREGQAVAFGWIETRSIYSIALARADWDNVVEDAAFHIVGDSPLRGKKFAARIHPKSTEMPFTPH